MLRISACRSEVICAARRGERRLFGTAVSRGHIGIIGCGGVGAACASSLIHRGGSVAAAITLYDSDHQRCRGEVLDLGDQAGFYGVQVKQAITVRELKGCDIIVVAAGAKCRPGESRHDLRHRNTAMLQAVVRDMLSGSVLSSDTIIVVATNPVDVLTAVVSRWLSPTVQSRRVIGSGTYIDSQRLRVLLSKRLCVPPCTVQAYVLGEHGDSQIAVYDMVTIGTGNLKQCGMEISDFAEVAAQTKLRAQQIVYRKGNTRHCVGECIAAICTDILQDTQAVVPVSTMVPSFNCFFGWPSILGKAGVERVLPMRLTAEEDANLTASASILNHCVDELCADYPI